MSRYRDRTRKTVTLPSGAVAVVVRLAPIHLIELGDIPLVDFGDDPKRSQKERTAKSMAPQWKLERLVLKNCVLSFEFEGEKSKLVDKPAAQCEDGELSIDEIEPADVVAIQRAVTSLSEGRLSERAKTFPEGEETGRSVALNGESLRSPANGTPETALA